MVIVMPVIMEVEVEVVVAVVYIECDANEYLYLDTQAQLDITLLEVTVNTYVTDIASIASPQTEL